MGTLYGPVLGAFVLVLLRDQIQDITVHWQLVQGVFVILVVLFLPHGVAGLVARLGRRGSTLAESSDDNGDGRRLPPIGEREP
ncbi:MAG: hypothetical protein ACTSQ7_10855 [Alphaproteobacteria bacterium]